MKRLSGKPDLSDWNLPDVFDEEKTFKEMFQDGLEQTLECIFEDQDDKAYIFFPIEWGETDGCGGPGVSDPLTIYLRLDSINTHYAFNLREALAGSLEFCAEDGSFSDQLPKLSHALRELANDIDAVCDKPRKGQQ